MEDVEEMREQRLWEIRREAEKEPQTESEPEEQRRGDMETVPETPAKAEAAPGVVRRETERLSRRPSQRDQRWMEPLEERKGAPVRETQSGGKRSHCRETQTRGRGDSGSETPQPRAPG